ncbi:hypothetical protein Q7P37_010682 [Cladosporium fusiforme]
MMEAIEQLLGSGAAISPSGDLLACIAQGRLKICYVQAPERTADFKIRLQSKDIASIKWSDNNARVLLSSAQSVEVIDLDDESHRVRLDNGSGGLGRFVSADFVGNDHLLTIWEFGRAKLWDLNAGKGIELGDFKTKSEGRTWALRPSEDGMPQALAFLSRAQAQDQVTVHFPSTGRTMEPTTISTVDARNISWSPDGRWISVLDTAHAHPGLVILTPDGQPFRSYPSSTQEVDENLHMGIKAITWSSDSRLLAISRHDTTITLLNTKTFTPLAVVEHSTTIDQQSSAPGDQAIIWQESISASNARTYAFSPQPVSPPLSRAKPSTEPSEIGVAEARFSADGRYLATRDENMLSTVWIWDTTTLRAHAVLIQHNSVRRMHWHPTRRDLLLLDCNENISYLFNASSSQPPVPVEATLAVTPLFSFAPTKSEDSKPVILAATRTAFTLIFPEGKDEVEDAASPAQPADADMDDSLFEVLTGRTPAPAKTQPSYTEQVDIDADVEGDTAGLDDTFREKRRVESSPMPPDPLDDSQIF